MLNLEEIVSRAKLELRHLVAVYPYGSRVYGNFRKNSDFDFIIITRKKTTEQFSDRIININFYTPEEHQKRLDEHEISALECYFLPKHMVVLETQMSLFNFKLDLTKLRHALSAKSSNSWAKAHKKLTIEKDYDLDLGRKSLFHSIRIIDYGIQIATHGKIVDYGSCNKLFEDIMNCYTWADMFDEYKQYYNKICSEFRVVAPK